MQSAGWKSNNDVETGRERRAAQHKAGRIAAAKVGARLSGKPCNVARGMDGAPIWPNGLRGSISHCNGRSVAIAGHAGNWCGLGIDIEQHLSVEVAKDIAPVALTPYERAHFKGDPLWIALIFSAKESLFKALSPLIDKRFDFDAAELCVDAHPAPYLRLTRDLTPDWCAGRAITPLLIPCKDGVLTAVTLPNYPRNVAPPSIYKSAIVM